MNDFATMQRGAIPSFSWASLPAAASMPGIFVRVTDVGINGTTWISDGTKWSPIAGIIVLAQSNLSIPAPSDTNENTLVSKTVQGGLPGTNGKIVIDYLFSNNSNANNKAIRIKIGSTLLVQTNQTTSATGQGIVTVRNANSASQQKAFPSGVVFVSSASIATSSVDTSQDFTISIASVLANASDTLALEGYTITLYRS